jgi:hypothetical protein
MPHARKALSLRISNPLLDSCLTDNAFIVLTSNFLCKACVNVACLEIHVKELFLNSRKDDDL